MRRTPLLLLLIIALCPKSSFSQIYIEPFGGYQKDINNHKGNLFNSGVQLALKRRNYEFLIQIQKSWPLSSKYTDSSFTLNTGLPLYAPAQKKVHPSSFSFGVGNRVKLAGRQTKNSLFATTYIGIMYQKMDISYQYDKINYVVLNPDKTISKTGLYAAIGLAYMRQFTSSRVFAELNLSSPPAGSGNYPNTIHFVAPLSLQIGYSIQLSKK